MLKKIISILKIRIIYFLDLITPKSNNIILFSSNGGNSANGDPRVIFKYLNKYHKEYNIYFMLTPNGHNIDIPNENIVYNNSFKGAILFIKAKYLIGSHIPRDFRPYKISRRKKYIQTWHGVGFKKTFFSMSNVFNCKLQAPQKHLKLMKQMTKRVSFLISPSEIISAIYCRALGIDSRKVITTGLPAIDEIMFIKNELLLPKLFTNILKYNKVILYATTFRRDPKVTKTEPVKYFPFDDMDFEDLDNFLEKNNIIILIRDHLSTKSKSELQRKRILSLNSDICPEINDIYSETDLLITDWSSVAQEFGGLNKPVMQLLYDKEEYIKSPGILVDDFNFWSPSYKPESYSEFILDIKEALFKEDRYSAERTKIFKQLFTMQDGNSCKRVVNLIKKI